MLSKVQSKESRSVSVAVPAIHRSNFRHLYLDTAWFGVLSGSAVSFLSVYLVRIGADSFQVGLVSAAPAIMAILFALPSGAYLKGRPIDKSVFWSSAIFRFFYLLWVPVPWLFDPSMQLIAYIVLIFAMSIPGTILAVGFNGLFAAAVPAEWRGYVAGVRNAVLSISFIVTSLACGAILEAAPFPLGYQIVFGIGFVGAALSSLHLGLVRVAHEPQVQIRHPRSLGDLARPGWMRGIGDALIAGVGLRFLLERRNPFRLPNLTVWRGPFAAVLLVLFVFHLTQFLAVPLFPIYWVEKMQFTDREISIAHAVFYLAVFLGSLQLGRATQRWGNYRLFVVGTLMMAGYPALTAIMHNFEMLLLTSFYGGITWSLAGGALANYLLERVPDDERPAHLAWYNLTFNVAVLLGSLTGPLLSEGIGLVPALLLIAVLRVGSSLAIKQWGK